MPNFPYPTDSLSRDYFISQFIESLHKAADPDNSDLADWFGRVIGWSPGENSERYYFRLGANVYPMEQIITLIRNKDFVFEIGNVDSISYQTIDNVEYATFTADVKVTDNRGINPTVIYEKSGVTITHRIKPTFQTYHTIFP